MICPLSIHFLFKTISIIILAWSLAIPVFAQTIWVGEVNNQWELGENWTNGRPTAGNDAEVPDPSQYGFHPHISQMELASYNIDNEGEITILFNGILDLALTHSLENKGTIINSGGEIKSTAAGTITNNGGFIENNNGMILIQNTAEFYNENVGEIINKGDDAIIKILDGGLFNNNSQSILENTDEATIEITGTDSKLENTAEVFNSMEDSKIVVSDNGLITNEWHIHNISEAIFQISLNGKLINKNFVENADNNTYLIVESTGQIINETLSSKILNHNNSEIYFDPSPSLFMQNVVLTNYGTIENKGSRIIGDNGTKIINKLGGNIMNIEGAWFEIQGYISVLENEGIFTNSGTNTRLIISESKFVCGGLLENMDNAEVVIDQNFQFKVVDLFKVKSMGQLKNVGSGSSIKIQAHAGMENFGEFSIDNNSQVIVSKSTLNNYGSIQITQGAELKVEGDGSYLGNNSTGSIEVLSAAKLSIIEVVTVPSGLHNAGRISLSGFETLCYIKRSNMDSHKLIELSLEAKIKIEEAVVFLNEYNSVFTLYPTSDIEIKNSIISNSGIINRISSETINLDIESSIAGTGVLNGNLENRGINSPGLSPGKFQINGNYVHDTTAVYEAEILNTDGESIGNDVIEVDSTFILGGTLDVRLLEEFEPSDGDIFTIMRFDYREGKFDTLLFPELPSNKTWDISYNEKDITLSVRGTTSTNPVSLTPRLKVFPTLAKDILNISSKYLEGKKVKIELISQAGHVAMRKSLESSSDIIGLEISSLSQGQYTLLVIVNEKMYSERFIKIDFNND